MSKNFCLLGDILEDLPLLSHTQKAKGRREVYCKVEKIRKEGRGREGRGKASQIGTAVRKGGSLSCYSVLL